MSYIIQRSVVTSKMLQNLQTYPKCFDRNNYSCRVSRRQRDLLHFKNSSIANVCGTVCPIYYTEIYDTKIWIISWKLQAN